MTQIDCVDLFTIKAPAIQQVVLALGTNENMTLSLDRALGQLWQLGEYTASPLLVGADHTGKTQTLYHNLCLLLTLKQNYNFCQLIQELKAIECACGTTKLLKQQGIVPMDIDILAIKVSHWHLSQRRLPLKHHEWLGLQEVAPALYEFLDKKVQNNCYKCHQASDN